MITVKLHQIGPEITLTVSDDGIGFDPTKVKEESLGLELVDTLCTQINGKFNIDSSEKGSNCHLSFTV